MKNLYINARFLTQTLTGVQRYAIELLQAMDLLLHRGLNAEDIRFTVLVPRGKRADIELKHMRVKQVGYLRGHLWEQLELPLYARDGLLLNLCNASPIMKRRRIVTLHDASVFAVPYSYSFAFRFAYRWLFRLTGQSALRIITPSQYSREQLMHWCKISPSIVRVIGLGVDHIHRQQVDPAFAEKLLPDMPFIVAVGSLNPHKNLQMLERAVREELSYTTIIAGSVDPRVYADASFAVRNAAAPGSDSSLVRYAGRVDDRELRTLYEHAVCFVFPSLYEGFGLPPLEAMACGCPVIVSHAASLPEVCGDAALYCDPTDAADIAAKIRRVIDEPALAERLRRRGIAHAAPFTWERCARETFAVIQEVLS